MHAIYAGHGRLTIVNIYDIRRYGTVAFLFASIVVVAVFLYFSNSLVKDLAAQERARMQIWAGATKQIVNAGNGAADGTDIDFLLSIIEANTSIPVMLTDDNGNIVLHRNFRLPAPADSSNPLEINEENARFLLEKLSDMRRTTNVIDIEIDSDITQHLYYEDSTLLRNLSLYPYVQLIVMAAFVMVVYFAVTSSKKAEQNKVWVGLSKETAHQLGTPISSLMAWIELMRDSDADPEMVEEMDKDVKRLSTIASRFSKIGSQPNMESTDLNEVVGRSVSYMSSRISSRIDLSVHLSPEALTVSMSAPLIEWVMENLIKNAVDDMESRVSITVTTYADHGMAVVLVKDTGKGMTRKMRKEVFRAGYTTKKRGWGLGLTLARRIVEQYHGGRIFVSESEPGAGTTFRIQLPLA